MTAPTPKPAAVRDIASHYGDLAGRLILAGKHEEAHAAVHEGFRKLAELEPAVSLKTPVGEVLRPRIAEILAGAGVRTIGQLCEYTRHELASQVGIRYRSVDIIEADLWEHGFTLAQSDV